ncbi:hypothetical protein TRVA0_058S00122 [Trichomonascus vanleenenianus]|uniref:Npr3p n=1 Tax=Trichomonascus vanleenenianus TaxID=2268995 RepID=UPI003EC9E794
MQDSELLSESSEGEENISDSEDDMFAIKDDSDDTGSVTESVETGEYGALPGASESSSTLSTAIVSRDGRSSLLDRLDKSKQQQQQQQLRQSLQTDSHEDLEKTIEDDDSRRSSVAHGGDPSDQNDDGSSWKKALGFDVDFLGELLSPPQSMCNTRFEMTVDDLVFLGIPIHIQQDGQWKRRRPRATTKSHGSTLIGKSQKSRSSVGGSDQASKESRRKSSTDSAATANGTMVNEPEWNEDSEIDEEYERSESGEDEEEEEDDEEEDNEGGGRSRKNSNIADYTDPRSPMRMFHVTFVMNPPVTEYNVRLDEMYHFVLLNFVRSLRYEQARSNYVWQEVATMLHLRDNAQVEKQSAIQLWNEMRTKSTLAASIEQLYEAVSKSDIANVVLNGRLRSFQIPIENVFSTMPPITDPYKGIGFLQTIGPFVDTSEVSAMGLTQYYAILLLDEPESIIRDVRADPYSPLAAFIREISPTESIQTLAASSGLTVNQIIEMTCNLIYWRRARHILPIHHRNVYIVSPMAPIAQMQHYMAMFKDRFPSMPSLPRILSMLSTGKPRSFSAHIPSRDHRNVYMVALGWLMRYGFVTQLRTFAWLKVSKRIKQTVAQEEEILQEEIATRRTKKNADRSTDNTSKREREDSTANKAATKVTTGFHAPKATVQFKLDVANDDDEDNDNDNDDDDDDDDEDNEEALGTSKRDVTMDDLEEDTILLEPDRASAIQRKWMAKMIEGKSADVQANFYKIVKYLNGVHTMEKAMVLEGLSRQEMRRVINALEEHIMVVRHW